MASPWISETVTQYFCKFAQRMMMHHSLREQSADYQIMEIILSCSLYSDCPIYSTGMSHLNASWRCVCVCVCVCVCARASCDSWRRKTNINKIRCKCACVTYCTPYKHTERCDTVPGPERCYQIGSSLPPPSSLSPSSLRQQQQKEHPIG